MPEKVFWIYVWYDSVHMERRWAESARYQVVSYLLQLAANRFSQRLSGRSLSYSPFTATYCICNYLIPTMLEFNIGTYFLACVM